MSLVASGTHEELVPIAQRAVAQGCDAEWVGCEPPNRTLRIKLNARGWNEVQDVVRRVIEGEPSVTTKSAGPAVGSLLRA